MGTFKSFSKDLTSGRIYGTLVLAGKGKLVLPYIIFERYTAGLRMAGYLAAAGAVTRGRPECMSLKAYFGTPEEAAEKQLLSGQSRASASYMADRQVAQDIVTQTVCLGFFFKT